VRIYGYAYEGGPSFVAPCWSDKLIEEINVINEPDNVLEIQLDNSATSRFTLYAADKAGNAVTQTVYTDAAGNLSITINDPENMGGPSGNASGAKAMGSGRVYTFLLNDAITVNLNTGEPEPESYTVFYESNGGTGVDAFSGFTGDEVEAPPEPVKEGYTFAGWFSDEALTQAVEWPVMIGEADVTLYAKWTMAETPALIPAEGSATVIDDVRHCIYGLTEGLSQEDFLADYVDKQGDCRIIVTPTPSGFGTGTKIELINNATDEVMCAYYIVIFGDMNGDGIVSGIDADLIINYENYAVEWDSETEPYLFVAGDLNGNTVVEAQDADIISNAENFVMWIDQTTGLAYAY